MAKTLDMALMLPDHYQINVRPDDETLSFLARDITNHPEHLQAVSSNLLARIHSLVGDVTVDLDAHLSADDE
ncbi:type II toxin-antitoxin system PrlF family antitoxin [Pseudomonas sp. NPDC089554]|uniref:type II toxin-antitoxin system PrlF family antitoxin n=1 Tax=Pseudomonas sp. NPDC089554 TaxID=3390653 RepID=UPI003CFD5C9E